MNYQETLDYISSINWKGSVLGLSRIEELLNRLGNPQKDLKFIHIAGTNGKGSTAAFLSAILAQAGYKVGLFTSPYIETYNERMQINNVNIPDEELAEITTYIRPFADAMEDKPTEFELNTAISFVYFQRNHCDVVVLEVGMGGELDSTNVIDAPEVAVICAIGLDHTEELGDTIEKIAATKAGIIKEGSAAVLYKQSEAVMNVMEEKCRQVQVPLFLSEPETLSRIEGTIEHQIFASDEYGIIEIPLLGSYQKENLALALKTVEVLRAKNWAISKEHVLEGLKKTRWPGRFEIVMREPLFLVDGAHNPHGIHATTQSLKAFFGDEKLLFLFGVMEDKDYDQMLDEILPLAEQVFCVTPDNPRALPAPRLAEIIREKGVPASSYDTINHAVDSIIGVALNENRSIAALGSLYMIGDIKAYLKTK